MSIENQFHFRSIFSATVTTLARYGWAPVVVFLTHCAANVAGLYGSHPSIDIPMHFAGGFAIALFFAGALNAFSRERLIHAPVGIMRFLFLLAATMAITVLWEFVEWTLDALQGTRHIQVSLDNTMRDQLMGTLGGIAFLGSAAIYRRFAVQHKKENEFIQKGVS